MIREEIVMWPQLIQTRVFVVRASYIDSALRMEWQLNCHLLNSLQEWLLHIKIPGGLPLQYSVYNIPLWN